MNGIEELSKFQESITKDNPVDNKDTLDTILSKILEIYDILVKKPEEVEEVEEVVVDEPTPEREDD